MPSCGEHNATYLIEQDGTHRDLKECYHYRCEKYDFWFYVDHRPSPAGHEYDLIVTYATSRRMAGGLPAVEEGDVRKIEDNIRDYFRHYNLLGRKYGPQEYVPPIAFSWRLDVVQKKS
jgi:hypothetical protein